MAGCSAQPLLGNRADLARRLAPSPFLGTGAARRRAKPSCIRIPKSAARRACLVRWLEREPRTRSADSPSRGSPGRPVALRKEPVSSHRAHVTLLALAPGLAFSAGPRGSCRRRADWKPPIQADPALLRPAELRRLYPDPWRWRSGDGSRAPASVSVRSLERGAAAELRRLDRERRRWRPGDGSRAAHERVSVRSLEREPGSR